MKNKLVLYLLVSLVASCIYPVTVWAKVNERFSLKNESVSEQMEKPLNFDPFGHARFAHLFVLYD